MNKILVTGKLTEDALDQLKKIPKTELVYLPDCSHSILLNEIKNTSVLITRSETQVTKDIIDAGLRLKVIAAACVGVAHVDLDYATTKGILVLNSPGKNTNSAAELSVGLLLALARKIPQAYINTKKGKWDRHLFTGIELKDKTVGIIGLGNVGHRMAKFCLGLDMKVIAYDPYLSPKIFAKYHVQKIDSLKDLLMKSQVLTIHVPLNKETKGMLTYNELKLLPQGALVINAARGGIICEDSLLKVLNENHLMGAALDTWENEPTPKPDLMEHERILSTPHIGASTLEAQKAVGLCVVAQVQKALSGQVVDHPVNLPEIGVITNPMVQKYTILAESLGSIARKIEQHNPTRVEIMYRGELSKLETKLIKLGFLTGYMRSVSDQYVSYVNCEPLFKDTGVELIETADDTYTHYNSSLKIIFSSQNVVDQTFTLSGVVFDQRYLRLTSLNDYHFEVEPKGRFLLIENEDQPGVVGDLGHTLGAHSVNIESFDLARNKKGGKAMALIKLDTDLDLNLLTKLRSLKHVLRAQFFKV